MIKHGKPKGVGNEADNGKGCKHAKENDKFNDPSRGCGKHKLEAP